MSFALLGPKTGHNRLGCALLLTCLQLEGRFPQHKHAVPPAAVTYGTTQLVSAVPLLCSSPAFAKT